MALEIFMESQPSAFPTKPTRKQTNLLLAGQVLYEVAWWRKQCKNKKEVQMNRISAEATVLARNNLDSVISKCGERKQHFSSKYLTSQSDAQKSIETMRTSSSQVQVRLFGWRRYFLFLTAMMRSFMRLFRRISMADLCLFAEGPSSPSSPTLSSGTT